MPKLLIIILAIIVLSVAGSVAFMQKMELGPFANEKLLTPEEKIEKLRRYISMKPLSISIFRGGAVATTIELKVQLETVAGREIFINKKLPKLKDALIRDLHSYFPRLLGKKNELDIPDLAHRMFLIGEKTLGKGVIEDLSILSASNRKLR
jgi:flagellar basal body-associated protein FliL